MADSSTDANRRYKVKKLGIRVNPPLLLMIYTEDGKLRQRRMPVRNFTSSSDCVRASRDMKRRHSPFMDSVPSIRLEKLMRLMQEAMKKEDDGEVADFRELRAKIEEEYKVDVDRDLNKVSPEELRRQKDLMEVSFQKSAVRPDDSNFVYDKQINFEAEKKRKSEWDSEDEDELKVGRSERPSSFSPEGAERDSEVADGGDHDDQEGHDSSNEHIDAEESQGGNRSDIEVGDDEKDSDW